VKLPLLAAGLLLLLAHDAPFAPEPGHDPSGRKAALDLPGSQVGWPNLLSPSLAVAGAWWPGIAP
jgi:hypothetical protein